MLQQCLKQAVASHSAMLPALASGKDDECANGDKDALVVSTEACASGIAASSSAKAETPAQKRAKKEAPSSSAEAKRSMMLIFLGAKATA